MDGPEIVRRQTAVDYPGYRYKGWLRPDTETAIRLLYVRERYVPLRCRAVAPKKQRAKMSVCILGQTPRA